MLHQIGFFVLPPVPSVLDYGRHTRCKCSTTLPVSVSSDENWIRLVAYSPYRRRDADLRAEPSRRREGSRVKRLDLFHGEDLAEQVWTRRLWMSGFLG